MFNINAFKATIATITGSKDGRLSAISSAITEQFRDAASSCLLEGSDSINQALSIVQAAKGGKAAKIRKAFDQVSTLGEFGVISHKGFTRTESIKGIPTSKADEQARIVAIDVACVVLHEALMIQLAPKAKAEKEESADTTADTTADSAALEAAKLEIARLTALIEQVKAATSIKQVKAILAA